MYQWRKFEFFQEKHGIKSSIPDEVAGKVECCSSGRGKIVIRYDDGTVSLLDRGLISISDSKLTLPLSSSLQHLKQRNLLVAVGEDEEISSQLSIICLKVFDLNKL